MPSNSLHDRSPARLKVVAGAVRSTDSDTHARYDFAASLHGIASQCRSRAAVLGPGLEYESLLAQALQFEAEAVELEATIDGGEGQVTARSRFNKRRHK
jgi:hypothetical protein